MENVARFSNSFIGKTVASGSKTSGSMYPTLTVTSTKDKFVLNGKALALMQLGEGQNVVLIDYNRGEVVTQDSNDRFYITAGWEKGKGAWEGAKLGKSGAFSYAGVYSAMQMNKPDVSEATIKNMEQAGIGIIRDGEKDADGKAKQVFIATQKVTYKVERLVQANPKGGDDLTEFEVSPGIFQPVYALTERDVVAHTPRELGGAEEDVDPEE